MFKVKSGLKAITGSGTGTISIAVDSGRTFRITKITWANTGAFYFTSIKNSATNEDVISGNLYETNLKTAANADVIDL